MKALLLLAGLAAAAPVPAAVAPPPKPAYPFKKVLVVVLENTDYKEALTRPFLKTLTEKGALLTDYHGVAHPSQPNYVAMVAGDTRKVKDDEKYELEGRTLADLLEAKGRTWAVYAEGYPGGCDARPHIKKYARKHQPLMSFPAIRADAKRCARIKPAAELDQDAAAGRLPDFALYVPDLDHDGHDTGSGYASQWMAKAWAPRLADPKFMDGLLVLVTFDEDGGTEDNRVYAVLLGPGVKPGAVSATRYSHYSIMRTVEAAFGLGDLGREDAKAAAFGGVWRTE